MRQLLAEELTAEGEVAMIVCKAESLKESVATFEADLIVLDLYVGGKLLWDLLKDIRSEYPAVPILLFTAFQERENPHFKDADGWVQKSFMFEELKDKIGDLLEQRGGKTFGKHPKLA